MARFLNLQQVVGEKLVGDKMSPTEIIHLKIKIKSIAHE